MPNPLSAALESLVQFFCQKHKKIEDFVTENEKENGTAFRKKILLNYVYFVTLYLFCTLILDLDFSFRKWTIYFFIPLCLILALSFSRNNFIVVYCMIYGFFSLCFYCWRDFESLKIIVIAFLSHQQFFLTLTTAQFRRFYGMGSFLLFTILTFNFSKGSEYDFEEFDFSFKFSKYIIILLYLPNYLCSSYINQASQRTFQSSGKTQTNKFTLKYKERIDFLEKENLTLKNELQARELFIASFSHEIRNSLNALIGSIELLRLGNLDEKGLKQLDVCKVIGEVMLDQVNNVLDVAKINADRLELNYTTEDFLKVIEKMWNISIIRIKQKGLRAELYISSRFPRYIEIDSHRLTQVLLNLIGNATKFTAEGFVKIILSWHENRDIESLKTPNQEFLRLVENRITPKADLQEFNQFEEDYDQPDISTIECLDSPYTLNLRAEIERRRFSPRMMSQMLASNSIFISSDSERAISKMHAKYTYQPKTKGIIKIEVIDTGCGMSRVNMQKLFQPFTQADSSISHKFGGTGLGLYITKKIIEAMKGQIQVYSQQNIGSDFCVLIPVKTADEEEYFQKQLHNHLDRVGKKVPKPLNGLIIDAPQLQNNVTTLINFLKSLNINLDVAKDTKDAFQIYKNKITAYYAFILVDFSHLNFCKLIRRYEKDCQEEVEIPIIILSEHFSEEEKKICLDPKGDIKAAAVYQIPVIIEEVESLINTIIQKSKKTSASEGSLPKILVVDDDPFNTSIIQEYMKKHHIECITCSSGKEAIRKTYKEKFDLILMDLEMPGMDGFTATKLIREKWPDIIIIGMTGHRRDRVLQKAKDHGMNNIETKPLDFKKILAMVLDILD